MSESHREYVVAKAGGTSMATAESIERTIELVEQDPMRQVLVVSGPGAASTGDTKGTDELEQLFHSVRREEKERLAESFSARFDRIITGLGLTSLSSLPDEVYASIKKGGLMTYADTRALGEDLMAEVISDYTGRQIVDPRDLFLLHRNGHVSPENTRGLILDNLEPLLQDGREVVVAGFIGADRNKETVNFPRGGSDISAAWLTRFLPWAIRHDNITDVDGLYSANPRLVATAQPIREFTYAEQREFGVGGAQIISPFAVSVLGKSGKPTRIYNSNKPEMQHQTEIVTDREITETRAVLGISSRHDIQGHRVSGMGLDDGDSEVDKAKNLLKQQGFHNIHMTAGVDSFTLFDAFERSDVHAKEEAAFAQAQDDLKLYFPDAEISGGYYAAVHMVGKNVHSDPYLHIEARRLLVENGIEIIGSPSDAEGPSEIFIIRREDEDRAVALLHQKFVEAELDEDTAA